jgi:hypothetical protein
LCQPQTVVFIPFSEVLMKHAILGASKAHRWMTCPASIQLEATIPDEESFYAAEGTAAHALAEECLLKQKPPEHFIGVEFEGFVVDEVMASHVATYVDFCNAQDADESHVELRVDYSEWAAARRGSACHRPKIRPRLKGKR